MIWWFREFLLFYQCTDIHQLEDAAFTHSNILSNQDLSPHYKVEIAEYAARPTLKTFWAGDLIRISVARSIPDHSARFNVDRYLAVSLSRWRLDRGTAERDGRSVCYSYPAVSPSRTSSNFMLFPTLLLFIPTMFATCCRCEPNSSSPS